MARTTNWPTVRLEEVCEHITVGHVGPMVKEYRENGVPFLRSQNVRPFRFDPSDLKFISPDFHAKLKKSALRPNDVVVTRSGANTGQCCIIPSRLAEANCSDLVIFRPSNTLNPWFLMYVLNSDWGRATIAGGVVGAAQHHFNIGIAKRLLVQLPPLSIQQRIAATLSAYDELIENNSRRIKILEQMAQMLYREWFVNLRFPGHKKSKFRIEKGRRIPQGWQFKNLFDVSEVTYGFPFKSKLFTEERVGIPVVRIRDILSSATDTFTTESADEKYLLRNGDLLVGMDGNFHMGKWSGGRAYQNQRVVRFRPKENLSRYFLLLAIQEPVRRFDSTIIGTTVAHLSDRDLRSVEVLIPDNELLRATASILNPCFDLEINLALKNSTLRTTRDLLLPRLVSGEVSVEALDVVTTTQAS